MSHKLHLSLKNIGIISKTLKTVGADSHSLAKGFGEMSIEAAKSAMDAKNIAKNVQNAALIEKFGPDAVKTAANITEVGSAATGATTGISAFGVALKGLWASIAPFALPALGAIAKKSILYCNRRYFGNIRLLSFSVSRYVKMIPNIWTNHICYNFTNSAS